MSVRLPGGDPDKGDPGTRPRAGVVLGFGLVMLVAPGSARAAHWSIGSPVVVTASASMPATLSAVSCPSATECVAVGSYLDLSGKPDGGALAEMSNGSGWAVQSTPKVSWRRAHGRLLPFDIGVRGRRDDRQRGIVVPAGRAVERHQLVGPARSRRPGQPGQLDAISCSSPLSCMAVGGGTPDPAELWNGSTWTAEPVPGFRSHGTALPVASLSGVSCLPEPGTATVPATSTPRIAIRGSEVVMAERRRALVLDEATASGSAS